MIVGHNADNRIEFSPVIHQLSDGFLIAVESHRLHGCLVENKGFFIGRKIFGEVSPLNYIKHEHIHEIVIDPDNLIILPFPGIFTGSSDPAVIPDDLPAGNFCYHTDLRDLGLFEQLFFKGYDGFFERRIFDPGNADHHGLFHVKTQILVLHVDDLAVNGKCGGYQDQSDDKLEDNQGFSKVHSFGPVA